MRHEELVSVAQEFKPGSLACECLLLAPMLLPLDDGVPREVAVLVDRVELGGGREGCPRQRAGNRVTALL